eukprot:965299_1
MSRAGKKWTDEEEKELLKLYDTNNKNINKIAQKLNRTNGGCTRRLKRLITNTNNPNNPDVNQNTNEDYNQIINENSINNDKKIQKGFFAKDKNRKRTLAKNIISRNRCRGRLRR